MLRFAIPVIADSFCEHFGRCDGFFLCDLDEPQAAPARPRVVPRPKKRCESVPQWLAALGVTHVLAGGLGVVARNRLEELNIRVSPGHSGSEPMQIVLGYLRRPRDQRDNPCATFEHRHHHCNG